MAFTNWPTAYAPEDAGRKITMDGDTLGAPTEYVCVVVETLPAVSTAVTVNDVVPETDVSSVAPSGVLPEQVATPEPPGSSSQS